MHSIWLEGDANLDPRQKVGVWLS